MSVLDLVAGEVARAGRAARAARAALPAATGLALLTIGALWLARGRWLALPRVMPFLLWGAALAVGAGLARVAGRRLAARASEGAVARAIEVEQSLRRGALTGLLEVAPAGGAFVEHAARALGARLAPVATRPAPRHRGVLVRAAGAGALALALVLAFASVSYATRSDGWRALLDPVGAWRGTLLPPLALVEAPRLATRGSAVRIAIAAEGRREVTMRWRATGGGWQGAQVIVDTAGVATLVLPDLDADLALVADDGRRLSDTVHVRVVDRPFVGDVTLRASYPRYLGRVAERLASDAPLRLPEGTRLEIEGHASEPLSSVLLRDGAARLALATQGTAFRGSFTPSRSGSWTWEARGLGAPIGDVPPPLEIEVVPDSAPRVEILSPTGQLLVEPADRVTLDVLAQDDHALSGVWLRRWTVARDGARGPATEIALSRGTDAEWVGGTEVDLAAFALEPGMTLRLVAVARDGKPAGERRGTREGVSDTLVLRVPTAEEARDAARDLADQAVAAADAAARAQAQLAQRTETAARSRGERNASSSESAGRPPNASPPSGSPAPSRESMGFDRAEQAREIAEQQRALQERVAGLEEAARDLEDRLRAAGALDTALARQLQDAQRLLREAITPEMAAALKQLEGAAQQLDGERTRQSLAQLAEQQQRLRAALERSAEMLRRAALEGAMRTLADDAKSLAERQRALADSAARARPDATRARELADRTRKLREAMESLRERLERERASTGANATARAAAEAERAEAALRDALRDAPQGGDERGEGRERAGAAARQAADAMERSAEAMQEAREGQVREWKGELTDALDRSVQEMLRMARDQDALADRARQDPTDPTLRAEQSALQQGVKTTQQRLESEGRKSALLSPRTQQMMDQASQRVAQATREAAEGQRGQQQQAMQDAATSLRQAAAQLTRDRDRAAAAQSASGLPEMLEQLQQLAQQQGALNGQMQGLLPGSQQGQQRQGLDAAGREQARALSRSLARSQREVARQLDAIADADPTGRAQEMAREARLLAQALDQGAVDPATRARQERLFQRMLDAGRSLEKEQRDEGQRRESRAARGAERFTPSGGTTRGRDAERFAVPSWEELRVLSAEERRLVVEYFRRLNAEGRP